MSAGKSPLHQDALHESGIRHATGEALYVDDLAGPEGTLFGVVVQSSHAHARILSRDAEAASAMPGIAGVHFAESIPGTNRIGPIVHDEPLLAEDLVFYRGQPVALVVGSSWEACRDAAEEVVVTYEELPAITDLPTAIEAEAWLTTPHVIQRGDVDAALAAAAVRIVGETTNGAQDHFYLETQASLAIPGEEGAVHIHSSTQHPTEVQREVATVLGVGDHKVVCEVPRMGGAFGGKESQATPFACLAALGAVIHRRPVRLWLNRDEDMRITGKRHPFQTRYEAGFDGAGRLIALRADVIADGGWSIDLTGPIVDRALFHLDNAYFIESLHFTGRAARTNLPSNTAFRGFGGPQGMLVVEEVLNRYAERMGEDPADVRHRNFYGPAPRDRAPYGQEITENRLERIHDELMESSDYCARREAIVAFNEEHTHVARGIGFQPVKFGISFTKAILNQAGALVLIYADGTVQLNHGGTEMGQGLHTKMLAVCAHALGVRVESVRVMHTATDKVPNTSATAASAGSDLNGQAVAAACQTLVERMTPIARGLLQSEEASAEVCFEDGEVFLASAPAKRVSFGDLAEACWLERVSLAATGFYRTPGIEYDAEVGQGTPFYYFAYGAAVTEVEVHALTGEFRVIRVDILHDVGSSLVPSIDLGQVEGGYVQGLGWLTSEEVIHAPDGALLTHGPSTYKIPSVGDVPEDFRVSLLEKAPQPGVIHGSKAVGEPPLMLAISVVTALRHAVIMMGTETTREVRLCPPCTPERVLRAIEEQRGRTR